MDPSDPDIAIVRHHLAQAYEADGQPDAAMASLDRALLGIERQLEYLRIAGRESQEPAAAPALRAMRARLASAEESPGRASGGL